MRVGSGLKEGGRRKAMMDKGELPCVFCALFRFLLLVLSGQL